LDDESFKKNPINIVPTFDVIDSIINNNVYLKWMRNLELSENGLNPNASQLNLNQSRKKKSIISDKDFRSYFSQRQDFYHQSGREDDIRKLFSLVYTYLKIFYPGSLDYVLER
jgi:hypothetical protein